MSYIYLASPYSHPNEKVIEERVEKTIKYLASCYTRGEFVYSPIVMCHNVSILHKLPGDALWWQRFDFEMVGHAEEIRVLMLNGWATSVGIKAELKYAEELGKRISYVKELP